jgi:hypothetical protein
MDEQSQLRMQALWLLLTPKTRHRRYVLLTLKHEFSYDRLRDLLRQGLQSE